MGGVSVVLSGNFRQTLPVIPEGTKADEIKVCLKFSSLWRNVKTMNLSTNMRAHLIGNLLSRKFAQKLLQHGEGRIYLDNLGHFNPASIGTVVESIDELLEKVYQNVQFHYQNHAWPRERTKLTAKNLTENNINNLLLGKIPGNSHL